METIELKTTEPIPPVMLQCVDGMSIVVNGARRVHHTDLDHGRWTYMETILLTSDGEELSLDDASDIVHFDYMQNEVADKLLRVLDEPNAGMWPITASQLLKFVAAAPVEEVVKEVKETKEEVAEAA